MINVSNIERFATHDGPGIRTAVFLKGCPLRCPWCANPETQTIRPAVLYQMAKCERCGACMRACPNHAISFVQGQWHLDRSVCQGCGMCADACLAGALSVNGRTMRESDILETVLRDQSYYLESGGGLTLSGGEPLFQIDAVLNLLRLAKQAGLHTAVETTGAYELTRLKQCAPYIDLFLFDLKHTDPKKLLDDTGASFEAVSGNLSWLITARPHDVTVRIPVIPGFNLGQLDQIIAYAKSLGAKRISLLPFHNLGKSKWTHLQKPYRYENVPGLKKEALKQFEDDIVTIGG